MEESVPLNALSVVMTVPVLCGVPGPAVPMDQFEIAFRMFDIKLAIVYSILTSVTLYYGWPRISESLGSFAGIVLLIVMFWGARTWTAS